MSLRLFFLDTETTGIPSKAPLNHPSQPHIVSASGLVLFLPENRIIQSTSKLVQPNGWEWDDRPDSPDRAFQVHKLSVETCTIEGRTEKEVLAEVLHLWDDRSTVVAHNVKFDLDIISIAIARHYPNNPALLNAWRETPTFCTMQQMRKIRKDRGEKGGANLLDTYKFFFEEPYDKAHSANADVVALYRIYCAMTGV